MNENGVPNLHRDSPHVCASWIHRRIACAQGHLVVVFHDCMGDLQVMHMTHYCEDRIDRERAFVLGTYDRRAQYADIMADVEASAWGSVAARRARYQCLNSPSLAF